MIVRNENRLGYKKTKVGWIPNEWEAIAFGKVVLKSQYGLSIASSETGHIQMLGMKDITEGYVSFIDLAKVDVTDEQLQRYIVRKGNLLFNRTNSLEHVGKLGLVNTEERAVFASYLVRFQVKCTKTFPEYIAYVFSTEDARNRLRSLATPGVCQHNINQSVLQKHYMIPFPPLPEQKKIAEILSTWDEAIEQTRKLIEAKKRRKKALMQQLLTGKKRLPGFTDAWTLRKLGDLFSERIERNYESLELLAITRNYGVVSASTLNRKDSSSSDKSKYKRIAKGDIGYNTMRMWQGVSALSKHEGIISPAYTVCIPNDTIHGEFAAIFFKFCPVVHTFWRYSQGLVNDTLNLKFHNFSQIHLKIPGIDEQYSIADVLSSADMDIKTLDEKLSALKKQKRGLMQKLLTGEVRVITKYVLDTCIFNWLLNGRISHDDLPGDAVFVITHLQIDEINKTSNEELRARLQLILTKLTHEVIPTETLVFNISRFDNAKMGNGALYTILVSEMNRLSKRQENNIRDSLIAETAIQNGYGLLTADRNLAKVARRNGCNVRLYTNTEKC